MTQWAARIGEETGGKVVVETFPSGSLLGRDQMFNGVETGIVDIGMAIIHDPAQFPLQYGFGLPLNIANATQGSTLLFDLIREFDPQELKNFKVITVFSGGPGYLQSRDRITSLEDMKGKEIRATGGGVDMMRKLGANPVGMPITEVPQALQTGVIDGYMTSMTVIKDFKLAEMVGHVTMYPMNVATFAVVMNRAKWDALPADVQAAIDSIGRELAIYGGSLYDKEEVVAVEWAKAEHGVEFHELDAAEAERWNAAAAPLVQEWVDAQSARGVPAAEFLKRLEEMRAAAK
jgi:TRAP-type C4-dicarboxylate transport system substrate-binding protein